MKLINRTGALMVKYDMDLYKACDMLIESGVDGIDLIFPDDHYQKMPKDKEFKD